MRVCIVNTSAVYGYAAWRITICVWIRSIDHRVRRASEVRDEVDQNPLGIGSTRSAAGPAAIPDEIDVRRAGLDLATVVLHLAGSLLALRRSRLAQERHTHRDNERK